MKMTLRIDADFKLGTVPGLLNTPRSKAKIASSATTKPK